MAGVVQENVADDVPRDSNKASSSIKATAWNIERGLRLEGIIRALCEHPSLRESDVLLLTELDYGMARTGNRFVAREIAAALKLNYIFAPCYLALNKGSGLESEVAGENEQSLHGNALFSRYPLREAHSIPLPNGKDKMRGKEKRLGCQRAVAAIMDHPLGSVWTVSLHLDAHSTQRHRQLQMQTSSIISPSNALNCPYSSVATGILQRTIHAASHIRLRATRVAWRWACATLSTIIIRIPNAGSSAGCSMNWRSAVTIIEP